MFSFYLHTGKHSHFNAYVFSCCRFVIILFLRWVDFFYFSLAIISEKQRELDSTKTELKKAFSDKKALQAAKGRIFIIHTYLSTVICNFMQLERNSLTFGEACKFPTSMYYNKYRIYLMLKS